MRNQNLTPTTPTSVSPAAIPAFAPDLWLYQVFSPLAVAGGAKLRRDIKDVEQHIGRDRFFAEAAARGYVVKEEGRDFVLTLARKAIRVMV